MWKHVEIRKYRPEWRSKVRFTIDAGPLFWVRNLHDPGKIGDSKRQDDYVRAAMAKAIERIAFVRPCFAGE